MTLPRSTPEGVALRGSSELLRDCCSALGVNEPGGVVEVLECGPMDELCDEVHLGGVYPVPNRTGGLTIGLGGGVPMLPRASLAARYPMKDREGVPEPGRWGVPVRRKRLGFMSLLKLDVGFRKLPGVSLRKLKAGPGLG